MKKNTSIVIFIILVFIFARFVQTQIRDNLVLTDVLKMGSSPTFTQDGKSLILGVAEPYSWGKPLSVWKMDLDGNLKEKVFENVFVPRLRSDGRTFLFETTQGYEAGTKVWEKDIVDKQTKLILNSGHADFVLDRSEDGRRILFKRAALLRPGHMGGKEWDRWDLFEIDLCSKVERKLTSENYFFVQSGFYIGDEIYFVADQPDIASSNGCIWKMRVGSPPRKWKGKNVSNASYASHANTLLYWEDSEKTPRFRVFKIDLPSNQTEELYATSTYFIDANINKQGDKVVMLLDDWSNGNRKKLFLFDVKSKQIRQIKIKFPNSKF